MRAWQTASPVAGRRLRESGRPRWCQHTRRRRVPCASHQAPASFCFYIPPQQRDPIKVHSAGRRRASGGHCRPVPGWVMPPPLWPSSLAHPAAAACGAPPRRGEGQQCQLGCTDACIGRHSVAQTQRQPASRGQRIASAPRPCDRPRWRHRTAGRWQGALQALIYRPVRNVLCAGRGQWRAVTSGAPLRSLRVLQARTSACAARCPAYSYRQQRPLLLAQRPACRLHL